MTEQNETQEVQSSTHESKVREVFIVKRSTKIYSKYAETGVNTSNKSIEMNFSIIDFKEAIKDQSVMNIPLYMVSKQ